MNLDQDLAGPRRRRGDLLDDENLGRTVARVHRSSHGRDASARDCVWQRRPVPIPVLARQRLRELVVAEELPSLLRLEQGRSAERELGAEQAPHEC